MHSFFGVGATHEGLQVLALAKKRPGVHAYDWDTEPQGQRYFRERSVGAADSNHRIRTAHDDDVSAFLHAGHDGYRDIGICRAGVIAWENAYGDSSREPATSRSCLHDAAQPAADQDGFARGDEPADVFGEPQGGCRCSPLAHDRNTHCLLGHKSVPSFEVLTHALSNWSLMDMIPKTRRTTLHRLPKRAVFDRDAINKILDAGFICHVAFVVDGSPVVIPTSYARSGNRLFIHGSAVSRMATTLASGAEVCVAVTVLDGLVLARSVFNHSMNYRSVVIFGNAVEVSEPAEKMEAMRAFSDHVLPGRWNDARQPTENELAVTLVLSLPIEEASAKVRSGPPVDKEEDLQLPVWAGVIPLTLQRGEPMAFGTAQPVPDYILRDTQHSNPGS